MGEVVYQPYNRFPIGTHALVKLVILPFQPGSSAELYAARIVMLLFFSGSAVLAYLSLDRIVSNKWIALAATMLTLSSTYALYYNDMVAPDGITNVFGILLTLHGLIIFMKEKKMRQLLTKIAISLLVGWPVLAFLFLFSLFGIVRSAVEQVRKRKNLTGLKWIFTNKFIIIGSYSLLISGIIFGFNIINESLATNQNPLDTPSIISLRQRAGIDQVEWGIGDPERLAAKNMVSTSFYRIAAASIPFAIPNYSTTIIRYLDAPLASHGSIAGMVILSLSIVASLLAKERIILMSLVFSGLLWILIFRYHTLIHDFTALFLIGIPLVLFAYLLQYLMSNSRRIPTAVLAISTLALFIFSVSQMKGIGHDSDSAVAKNQIRQDFSQIREVTRGHSVFVSLPEDSDYYPAPISWYYMPGSFISDAIHRYEADFFVSNSRVSCGLITQENLHVFLYDSFASFANCEIQILDGSPVFSDAILTPYQIYLQGKLIHYAHEGYCGQHTNSTETFFLHVFPVGADDLPSASQEYGFANLDFQPGERWQNIDGHCIIGVQLPTYDIASIQTGQYSDQGTLWSTEIRIAEPE